MRSLLLVRFVVFWGLLTMGVPVFSEIEAPRALGEFLLRFKDSSAVEKSIEKLKESFSLNLESSFEFRSRTFLFKRESVRNSVYFNERLLQAMKRFPGVDLVEPNYLYSTSFGSKPAKEEPPPEPEPILSNDFLFSHLWGFLNLGARDSEDRLGIIGADASVAKAWNLSTGTKKIVVGAVDTGIDYRHPDLIENMWTKFEDGEVLYGYNPIRNQSDPMDDNGHGTHVAGTIGAVGNNGLGVVGVNWDVRLMSLKFLRSDGTGRLSDAVKVIDWGVANGVDVMNHSYGGGGRSQFLADAFKRAQTEGVVMVAAAGNNWGNNNDERGVYPANYEIESLITVASSNNRDQLSEFSNYGPSTVDIAAPGENILSTSLNGEYETLSGTSMAAPHVSGAVALILSQRPHLNPFQVYSLIVNTVDEKRQFSDKLRSGGRLNVYKALSSDMHTW